MQLTSPASNYIQRLPYEIVAKITRLLSKKDALQCMMACKSWYSVALPIFYESVFIHYELAIKLASQLETSSKYLRPHPKLDRHGKLIKSIRIEDKETVPGFQAYIFLSDLLRYIPNIKTIDLSLCKDVRHYLFSLSQRHTSDFAPSLGNIKFFSPYDFNSAKDFSPGPWELGNHYFNACLNFMDSITHLELHDIHSKIYFAVKEDDSAVEDDSDIEDDSAVEDDSPLEFIGYFPQLTHLTVSANEAKYIPSDGESPFEEKVVLEYVLQNCANLQSLNLLHYHSVRTEGDYGGTRTMDESRMVSSDPWENLMIGRQQQREAAAQRQNSILRTSQQTNVLWPYILKVKETLDSLYTGSVDYRHRSKRVFYPKLKQLTYVSSELSLNEVQFISHHLSTTHLQDLTLVVNRLCALEWFNEVGFENAFRFAHYLSQVNNLQFKFAENGLDRSMNTSPMDYSTPIQEMWTRTLFWKFIDTIRSSSRDIKYSIRLDVSPETILFHPKTRLTVNRARKSIRLEQAITMHTFLYSDFASKLLIGNLNVTEVPPPPEHAFLPEVAQETRYLEIYVPPSDCLRELRFALKTFTQLRQLIIRAECGSLLLSPESRRRSIQCHRRAYTVSPGHTEASLTNIHLTQEFQQGLTESLPHLESLDLVDCDFLDAHGFISKKCTLDLRRLSNLQNLRLTIQTNTSSYNKVLVRVKYYLEDCPGIYDMKEYWVQDILMNKPSSPTQKVDERTMILNIKVSDKLRTVTFMESTFHPPDAILS